MAYCLDSNIFIQASRTRFPVDIFPVFWTKLEHHAGTGHVLSIAEVRSEILKGNDALAEWAKQRTALFQSNDDEKTALALAGVGAAVEAKRPAYQAKAKTHFLDHADPWVIAFCKAHGHILVTEETGAPDSVKSVKIPDIAKSVGVTVMNLNDMLRALGITFK